MTEINSVRIGDILIDERVFTEFSNLQDYIWSCPSILDRDDMDGYAEVSGHLIWYLFGRLTFQKYETAGGSNAWVLTMKGI